MPCLLFCYNCICSNKVIQSYTITPNLGDPDLTLALICILLQAVQLLMQGAKEKHRGCLMALGNKHALGIDLPQDTEQGYGNGHIDSLGSDCDNG